MMKIARVIVKQSAAKELMTAYPTLFSDPKVIMEIQPDGTFNKQVVIEQITERYGKDKA
jgi:ribosomal protein S17E